MARTLRTDRGSYTAHFERHADQWRVHVTGLQRLTATGKTVQETRRRFLRKLRREHPEVSPEAVQERFHLEGEARNAIRAFRCARRRVMMGVSRSWVQRLVGDFTS